MGEDYLARIVDRLQSLAPGDPLDPATGMGPMISAGHRRRVLAHLERGRAEGARLVYTGRVDPALAAGSFLAPVVFGDLTAGMSIAREEIFGPVLGTLPVDGMDEALAVANGTEYGLHATVFTRDIDRALHFARRLSCGTVAVNGFTEGDVKTPFG